MSDLRAPVGHHCDVAIIGAGTAGIAAERSARRRGASTRLIDEKFAGTTCANVGCMPSKLLIAAANAVHMSRQGVVFGFKADVDIDGRAVMARVRKERDAFVAAVRKDLECLPDGILIGGKACFVDATNLRLDTGATVAAKAVVIATGARSSVPEFLDGLEDKVVTNESVFELEDLPKAIGVVGAGPLGLELAQALSRLGVEVAVFDQGKTVAGVEDDTMADCLKAVFTAEFPVRLGVKLSAKLQDGGVLLRWRGAERGEQRFDYVLAATGRPPNLEGLDLEETGLALDEHGMPDIEPNTMQCGKAPIFMAGDADHQRPVLHEAQAEGVIAGRNAASYPKVSPGTRMVPLAIMFTEPSFATIGERPKDCVTGMASYANQGRAKACVTNVGLVEFYADRKNGRLLGGSLFGPAAEHSAHLLAWAIQCGMTAADILNMPFYHPTYEEGLKPAFREICKAVGATVPDDRDGGFIPGV